MRLTSIASIRDSTDPRSDAIDLAHLIVSMIDSSEIGTLRWRGVPRASIISYTAETIEKEIRASFKTPAISTEASDGLGSDIDRSEHLVIRDLDLPSSGGGQQGRIIAHCEYQSCPADWFKRHAYTPGDPNTIDERIKGGNQALMDHFMAEIYGISERLAQSQTFYMLTALHTLDTHLRRGIASQLVQWIFPFADANRREVFLVASPIGAHVYWRNGYSSVEGEQGRLRIPLNKWGGGEDSVHEMVSMRRQPGGLGDEGTDTR